MDHSEILAHTNEHVRALLQGEGSGHDWWHVYRVWRNAAHIAAGEREPVDLFVVELAALLHDIADWKFHGGDVTAGPRAARAWLDTLAVDGAVIAHVCDIIATMSFKGAGVASAMRTREGMVVQDADRLDAIGAIGIARTFAYGGHMNRDIWDSDRAPHAHASAKDYLTGTGSTINHFYEKLLLLKDRMNTETGRRMASERHAFMEAYLTHFYAEWEGMA